jgi:hypothetical protein
MLEMLETLSFPLLLVSSAVLVMRSRFVSLCAGDKLGTCMLFVMYALKLEVRISSEGGHTCDEREVICSSMYFNALPFSGSCRSL